MNPDIIERDFKMKVSERLKLVPQGLARYRVSTPFVFDDGDGLVIVLKREGDRWILSDEGHTYMRLTYGMNEADLNRGTRKTIIETALAAFFVQDRDGELFVPIPDERFGDALYSFIQAILKISDVTYLSREVIRSTFMEDLRAFLSERVPENRRVFDWHDAERDPDGKYAVDCRVNGLPRPLFIFGLSNDDKVNVATISIHQFEKWELPMRPVGVFENQEDINRKALARFTDVCDRQFSNLVGNRDRIARFLSEASPA